MVEGGGGVLFPVVFFDGEREMEIGDIKVLPGLTYKAFQMMMSQKIGVSPNQISIYLVNRGKSMFPEDRRRIPITGKVNFTLICRQKDCCFLVVLKRSKKSRNRRLRLQGMDYSDSSPEDEFLTSSVRPLPPFPPNMILLRRDQPAPPFYDQITQSELENLNGRLQNLMVQRENYQVAMARPNMNPVGKSDLNSYLDLKNFPRIEDTMTTRNDSKKPLCAECMNARKNSLTTTSFHPCVNDAVLKEFRTRTTPIGLPPVYRPINNDAGNRFPPYTLFSLN